MSTRRSFLKHLTVGAAAWRMSRFSESSYRALAQAGPAVGRAISERPAWLREGIVAAGYLEPLEFYVRRGDAPGDIDQRWKEDFNDAGVKRYKEMGVNLVVMPLHKGMGLKTEAESIDATRKFTQIAHRHGIKVAGYVGSSMFYETFYAEEADAPGWEQVDERGRPLYYGDQTFRHAACRNNPGYRAFIQKVLRLGVADIKLDMFHFDQLQWWEEPWSCHCKYCQGQFRAYLRKKYTDHELKEHLGFAEFGGIRVPDFNLDAPPVRSPSELKDPLRQEWARFRCISLAEWWRETHEYIRQLNPEVALLGNPTMGPANNCGFIYGVDLQQLLLHSEFVWSEEGNQPRWTADGRMISMIRSYKAVRSMGKSLFVTQWLRPNNAFHPDGPPRLRLAEAIAYNDSNMGVVAGGWELGGHDLTPQTQQYVDFFRLHNKDLVDTTPVTDVAILRSFASIEFNPAKSNVSTMLFEQTLIQCKFPFGIIFDTHLKDLSGYKVLVLANQDALSDEQLDQIRRFVEAGGGLVATEETSMLTERRKTRNKLGLADVLGFDLPPDDETARNPMRREFSKGRVVYIPRIEPEIAPPLAMMSYYFSNQYWKLPKNYEELAEAVRWAARQEFSARVEAPLWVTMELAEQKGTNTWLLHLLNFRDEEPLVNIPVRIRIPDGMRLREAVLGSPDGLPRQILDIAGSERTLSFTVPKLEVYDLIHLRMERK
jgi:hypothetical protein